MAETFRVKVIDEVIFPPEEPLPTDALGWVRRSNDGRWRQRPPVLVRFRYVEYEHPSGAHSVPGTPDEDA